MKIVGIAALGDESGAALVSDGRIVAASAEERFSRVPKDPALPRRAVRYCLAEAGLSARDVDVWVHYEKPLRRFERVLAGQLSAFPRSSKSFGRELFSWLGERLWLKNQLASTFGVEPERIRFTQHQVAHAAAAFFLSPFDEAAILVADGAGEWATTTLARGYGSSIDRVGELHHPHSLVLVQLAVARFLGLPPSAVAAVAAYGKPRFADAMRRFIRVGEDAHVELDRAALVSDLDGGLVCAGPWLATFGPPRLATDPLRIRDTDTRDADLAASFQLLLEDATLALVRELHARVPSTHLCLGGDLADNAAVVARIAAEGPFGELYLPPACGDAGAALGAALYAHAASNPGQRPQPLASPFLGEHVQREPRADGTDVRLERERIERMVDALVAGRTVGWVRERAEYGSRTLGHRVLLADPRRIEMAARVSRGVSRREEYLPFSPALPRERGEEFFDVPTCAHGPARLRQILLASRPAAQRAAPATLHVDGRASPHFVDAAHDPSYHELLVRFGEKTGVPILLATALSLRGEPPVRGERDALALFDRSELDLLVVEDRIYAR